jgi:hypothetical protein
MWGFHSLFEKGYSAERVTCSPLMTRWTSLNLFDFEAFGPSFSHLIESVRFKLFPCGSLTMLLLSNAILRLSFAFELEGGLQTYIAVLVRYN